MKPMHKSDNKQSVSLTHARIYMGYDMSATTIYSGWMTPAAAAAAEHIKESLVACELSAVMPSICRTLYDIHILNNNCAFIRVYTNYITLYNIHMYIYTVNAKHIIYFSMLSAFYVFAKFSLRRRRPFAQFIVPQ